MGGQAGVLFREPSWSVHGKRVGERVPGGSASRRALQSASSIAAATPSRPTAPPSPLGLTKPRRGRKHAPARAETRACRLICRRKSSMAIQNFQWRSLLATVPHSRAQTARWAIGLKGRRLVSHRIGRSFLHAPGARTRPSLALAFSALSSPASSHYRYRVALLELARHGRARRAPLVSGRQQDRGLKGGQWSGHATRP